MDSACTVNNCRSPVLSHGSVQEWPACFQLPAFVRTDAISGCPVWSLTYLLCLGSLSVSRASRRVGTGQTKGPFKDINRRRKAR